MKTQPILAIDFDGTIVENEFPKIGKLLPYAKEIINKLYDEGYFIIIWSCRGGTELVTAYQFLRKNGIIFNKFNENYPDLGFKPFPKIYATYYIDDRSLFCDKINWRNIYKKLKKLEKNKRVNKNV